MLDKFKNGCTFAPENEQSTKYHYCNLQCDRNEEGYTRNGNGIVAT